MKTKSSLLGFTLSELIVTIVILGILSTIAFLSYTSYTKTARDTDREGTLDKTITALELFHVQTGIYPVPGDAVNITYSGATLWSQGVINDQVIQNLSPHGLSEVSLDPLSDVLYTYSVANDNNQYAIGTILESGETPSFAPSEEEVEYVRTYIAGNYNSQAIRTNSGATTYIVSVPSIISSDFSTKDYQTILSTRRLAYDGYGTLPASYAGKNYRMFEPVNFTDISALVYSGNISTLISSGGLQLGIVKDLQTAYSGSMVSEYPKYSKLIQTPIDLNSPSVKALQLVEETFRNKLGIDL